MCKGLLNTCASYSQGAHTGQWLLSVMIYGRALVSGRQLKLCFVHNLSILKEANSPTLGLGHAGHTLNQLLRPRSHSGLGWGAGAGEGGWGAGNGVGGASPGGLSGVLNRHSLLK